MLFTSLHRIDAFLSFFLFTTLNSFLIYYSFQFYRYYLLNPKSYIKDSSSIILRAVLCVLCCLVTLYYNRIYDNLLPRTLLYRPAYCSCNDARGQMKRLTTFPCPCPRPCPCCCTHSTYSRPCPRCITATTPAPAPRTWGAPWSVWALSPSPFINPIKLWTLWTYTVTYEPVSGGWEDKCENW